MPVQGYSGDIAGGDRVTARHRFEIDLADQRAILIRSLVARQRRLAVPRPFLGDNDLRAGTAAASTD